MPFISCTTLFLIVFPLIRLFCDISHKFRYNLSSILPKRPATVFSSSRWSCLSASCSRPLSGRGQSGHFFENDRLTSLPPFSPFLRIGRRVGCRWERNTLFSTTITSIYEKATLATVSEDCKGCICPLYGGQDLIFFNNLYEPRTLVLICLPFYRLGCGCWFRPSDLQVMNLTS